MKKPMMHIVFLAVAPKLAICICASSTCAVSLLVLLLLQVPALQLLEDVSISATAGPKPSENFRLAPQQTMYTTIGVAGTANASVTVLPPRQLVAPVWYKFECGSGTGLGAGTNGSGMPVTDVVVQSGWLWADPLSVYLWVSPVRLGAMFYTPGPKPGSVLLVDSLGRALRWNFTLLVRPCL